MNSSSASPREHDLDLDLHDAQRVARAKHLGGWRRNAGRTSAHPGKLVAHVASTAGARRVAVLFDIDGMLIDTGGAGAASWRLAVDELYGIPADIGQFTDAGMTDPDVGRKTFVAVLGREPTGQEFARLLEAGYLLGTVTGNLEAAAHIKLRRARLNRFFSFGGYGSDASGRGEVTRLALARAAWVYGEALAPDQAIVVGDTPHDVQAAHAAGVPCVGVANHFSIPQLRDAGADRVIASLKEPLPL